MIRNLAWLLFLLPFCAQAQFSTEKIQVRAGYQFHNAGSRRFNTLVDEFNKQRYPHVITENLGGVDFLRGYAFGANYNFREDMYLYGILHNKGQFLQTRYVDGGHYRQYRMRENHLELGLSMAIQDEGVFTHWASAGIKLGYLSVFTDTAATDARQSGRQMFNINHSAVLGLNIAYEAQIRLHDLVRIYIRPHFELGLNSYVRNLTDFMNPVVEEDGITYVGTADEKYNAINLNGLGIEGGLLISLPHFDF